MQPHEQRVLDEKRELDDRLERLRHFMTTGVFRSLDNLERDLMWRQAAYMSAYSQTLGERIEKFVKD
jgi:hypothetical protein